MLSNFPFFLNLASSFWNLFNRVVVGSYFASFIASCSFMMTNPDPLSNVYTLHCFLFLWLRFFVQWLNFVYYKLSFDAFCVRLSIVSYEHLATIFLLFSKNQFIFLERCMANNIIQKSLRIKSPILSKRAKI